MYSVTHVKVVSFDLTGTLVTYRLTNWFWFEEIPRMYAERRDIPIEQARELVKREYDKVGNQRVDWYEPDYFLKLFDIKVNGEKLLNRLKDKVEVYPEVPGVLERLSKKFELIITTNASRKFVDLETEASGIKRYFSRILSSTSDFREVKKTPEFYLKICNILGIEPEEMAHVGDHWDFDFVAPRKSGVRAFYLDRTGKEQGEFVVKDLIEFEKKLGISTELQTPEFK